MVGIDIDANPWLSASEGCCNTIPIHDSPVYWRLNMAKARRKRTQYSLSQRKSILAAASKENLTAGQVEKRFGVKPVTYYSWRKKTGIARPKGRRGAGRAVVLKGSTNPANSVRTEVRNRVQAILPDIVRSEVSQYLNELFASARGKRRSRL
jgi:transposase-like protein